MLWNLFKGLFAMLLLILSTAVMPAAQCDDVRAADHQEARQLLKDVTNAINTQDVKNIRNYFAQDYIYVGADQTAVTNHEEFVEYYNKLLGGPNALLKSLTFHPKALMKTKFIQDQVGIVYGESDDFYVLANNHKTNVKSKWSATLVKEDGKWKIATLHNGVNFYDNPEITYFTNFWKMIALLTLVIGFLLGFTFKSKLKST